MKIACIFDTHVKPGVDMSYLSHIGKYILEKKPDVIVHLGDHWDMPSLSSYDFGTLKFEGRRYRNDIDAGNIGMDILLDPIYEYNIQAKKNKKKLYTPRRVYLMGNHDQRIARAVNSDPKLEGVIGYEDLNLEGWEVYDFLDVAVIEDIAFSHYFVTGAMGRPATSANAILNKKHMSCIAGHQQGRQIATAYRADGKQLTCIICGSSYPHEEEYLEVQGNRHWRGIAILNEVNEGSFDEMFVSLNYLKSRYEG